MKPDRQPSAGVDYPADEGARRCRVDAESDYDIVVHLDELLEARGMTLTHLADAVDITIVNLSVLKNGRARAIRFSTLSALCEFLGCQPGELLSYRR